MRARVLARIAVHIGRRASLELREHLDAAGFEEIRRIRPPVGSHVSLSIACPSAPPTTLRAYLTTGGDCGQLPLERPTLRPLARVLRCGRTGGRETQHDRFSRPSRPSPGVIVPSITHHHVHVRSSCHGTVRDDHRRRSVCPVP